MKQVELDSHVMLEDYISIVGADEINSIREKADKLKGKSVTHVNSTVIGNGIAEELSEMVPLMNAVGLDAHWNVMEGTPEFFNVTKKIHNELQGANITLTDEEKELYIRYNKENSDSTLLDADFMIVHGNQPAAIIQFQTPKINKWIWRCHVDMSTPKLTAWLFLQNYVSQYDATIFTSERYVLPSPNFPKVVISTPSINPTSDKNREMTDTQIREILEKYGVNSEKPIITQVARFDQWKDPLGAIDVYRLVKKKIPDLQLLLVGSITEDDPEGLCYFENTARYACQDKDIHLLTDFKDVKCLEVNAFQRASQVVLQMSTREGFGLAVSEAMWKQVPVVGRNAGGISLQIIDGSTGFLIRTVPEAAEKIFYLLKNKDKAKEMGVQGKEHVRKNFLITATLKDYLTLFNELL